MLWATLLAASTSWCGPPTLQGFQHGFDWQTCPSHCGVWLNYSTWRFFSPLAYSFVSARSLLLLLHSLSRSRYLPARPQQAVLTWAFQWQWLHHCDSFHGEAILEGRSHVNASSLVTFYYAQQGTTVKHHYFDYRMSQQDIYSQNWTLELDNSSRIAAPTELSPLVQSVSYDFDKSTLSATCTTANDSSTNATECMWGYFIRDDLSIYLNDTRHINTEIKLRPVDKEWLYSNDAPSFALHYVKPNGQLGDLVMETAVTKRNHCELLKICLQAPAPTLDTVIPLGLALWAEDRYATYCYAPKFYG